MNQREIEKTIEGEVAEWPGAIVTFANGGKHPKAKLVFNGLTMNVTFPGTPSDSLRGLLNTIGDVRRALKKMGATRTKPEPSKSDEEAKYRKPVVSESKATKVLHAGERAGASPKPDVADQLVDKGVATAEQRAAVQAEGSAETYAKAEQVRQYVPHGAEPEEDEEDREAAIRAAAAAIEDGIYFGLPDNVYHAVPRLSSSGLQKLCVSPATFWRGSWLDPDAPPLDEEQTKYQLLGKAYHCARLEPDRFHDTYCRKPDKSDYGPELITADTGIKAALKDLGEPQTCGAESMVERALRLVEAGHKGPIWALVMHVHEQERAGRIAIDGPAYDQIVQDMQRIRGQGEIATLLIGGQAEVSVFWTDQHGLKCKCRFDYLAPEHWCDFKTFDNTRGKVLEQALADAVRYNRYYVQAVHYRDGAEAIRTGGLQVQGEATDEQRALIAGLQMRPGELACWFVFQEKNGVPNLLAREFPFYDVPLAITSEWDTGASEEAVARGHDATRTRTGIHARGSIEITHAKDTFVLYANAYDPGTPWFPLHPRGRFSDLDFNSHWLEGKY